MKNWRNWKTLTIAGATAALIGGGTLIGGAYADPSRDDDHYGMGYGMGMKMMGGPARMGHGLAGGWLQKFDLDGDGRITREEALQARARELEMYDANGDGRLTVKEFERAWLDYTRPMMVRRFQMHDTDADGQVTGEEYGAVVDRLFWRLDRNGDGVIEPAEMRRMKKDRRHRDDDDD